MTHPLPQPHTRKQPLLISFSGLDGAGKTTQIENVRSLLAAAGYRSELLAFWDNVVVLSRYREGFVQKVYKSEPGIGAPGQPVNRRDKNVRKWYLSFIRHGLYLLDALHLVKVLNLARRSGAGAIIMDRYIYDELANLPLDNPLTRLFVRMVTSLVPQPDLAYLLDADPDAAYRRKPEYPVEFMRQSRQAYFKLAELLGTLTVIPPLPLEDAKTSVAIALHRALVRDVDAHAPVRLDTAPAA
jgi:thymidylate kinase